MILSTPDQMSTLRISVLVTGTGTWVSQVPVETWYNEQLEIVGGDGNTIEQKRLVMLWN